MSQTHLSQSEPVARKNYRCYLCHRRINKGEKHLCTNEVCDGKATSFRMHMECYQVTIDHKWDEESWEYHAPGEFPEELAKWRAERQAK